MDNKHADKTTILLLCTGNFCRSQMAGGRAKTLKADKIDAYSAGIEKNGLNPIAVKVMAEAGADISLTYNYRWFKAWQIDVYQPITDFQSSLLQ